MSGRPSPEDVARRLRAIADEIEPKKKDPGARWKLAAAARAPQSISRRWHRPTPITGFRERR